MSNPRTQPQELSNAASALCAEARQAERQAANPQFDSVRATNSAQGYDPLAEKLTRIAERLGVGV